MGLDIYYIDQYNEPMRLRVPTALKTREYHVLLALASGDKHGLAIARDVEQSSDGRVRLWPAMLYGTLDDLVERGWIEEVEEPPAHESEKKRFYSLTRIGRGILTAETHRLATLVRAARTRLKRTGAVS